MRMTRLACLCSLWLCLNLLAIAAQAQTSPTAAAPSNSKSSAQIAEKKTVQSPTAASTPAKEVSWDALVPPQWNPLKEFEGMNLGMLKDGDPRATNLLKRMREVWDQAPVNEAIDGTFIRIPGYVVPLEESKDGMKEFLLVPYFGACIHSPPPPANQIIHVLSNQPVRGLRSMETVWVQGKVQAFRHDSFMGTSGYRIEAPVVELYVEKDKGTKGNR